MLRPHQDITRPPRSSTKGSKLENLEEGVMHCYCTLLIGFSDPLPRLAAWGDFYSEH